MSFFDLPAPLFSVIDRSFASVGGGSLRLALWAVVSSVVCMGIYRLTSNQKQIETLKKDIATAKASFNENPPDDMAAAMAASRHMLMLSLKQIGKSLGPTLLSGLPVIFVFAFLANTYSYDAPVNGAELQASYVHADGLVEQRSVTWPVKDEAIIPGTVPGVSAVIYPRDWTSALFGNPGGDLKDGTGLDHIAIGLTPKTYLSMMPSMLSGWEGLFLILMMTISLVIKFAFRIH